MYGFEGTEIKMLVFITEAFKKIYKNVFTLFSSINLFGRSIILELWTMDVLTGIRQNESIHNKRGEYLRSILNTEKKKSNIDFFKK